MVAHEISPRQITDAEARDEILRLIHEHPGIGEWDIAQELRISVMRVYDLVRELEDQGAVRRGERGADGA